MLLLHFTLQAAWWTRVNHLGNSKDLVPLNCTWTIPYFPSENEKTLCFENEVKLVYRHFHKCFSRKIFSHFN